MGFCIVGSQVVNLAFSLLLFLRSNSVTVKHGVPAANACKWRRGLAGDANKSSKVSDRNEGNMAEQGRRVHCLIQ